jgi:hypothetical protein
MGMPLSELERRMTGGELVAHIADMRIMVEDQEKARQARG